METFALTDTSRYLAGVVLLTVVGIEYGGYFLLRVARSAHQFTGFQKDFARAMHAHAGVLVIFSLVAVLLADAGHLTGFFGWVARLGIPIAAILIPGGFATSSMIGKGEINKPNPKFLWLFFAGAVALAAGVLSLGIGLLVG
jgi:hypothetical protein